MRICILIISRINSINYRIVSIVKVPNILTTLFYREDVNATCIDNNSMNHLWQREKSYIVTILPSIQPSLYGYVPVEITIQGVELVNPSAISHENRVVYTQRIMAIVSAVGEIQDLLDE